MYKKVGDLPLVMSVGFSESDVKHRVSRRVWVLFLVSAMLMLFVAAIASMLGKMIRTNRALQSEIAERRTAEAGLEESEARYRRMVDTAIEGIVSLDCGGRITFVNGQMASMLGYSTGEMTGRMFESFFPPDQLEDHRFQMSIRAQGRDAVYERCCLDRNGGRPWTLVSAKAVMDHAGAYTGSFAMVTDINERKKYETEITRQLEEKGLLLRETHHRIKNNIASIASLLSLHMGSTTSPEAVNALREAIGHVSSMVALYEKMQLSDDIREIPVRAYLEDLVDIVVKLYSGKTNISVEKEFDDFTLGSRVLFPLGIIVNELMTDAMKHAFPGRETGRVRISAVKSGNRVILTVRDDGAGLPGGFDPASSGGLGLMLVRMLSQQIGGTFTIESDGGTKSTVEFKA